MKRSSTAGAVRRKRRPDAEEGSSEDDSSPHARDARLRLSQKRVVKSATFFEDQATLLRGHKFPTTCAALSRDNTTVASVDKGGHVLLHDLATSSRTTFPQLTRKPINSVAFLSPTLIATAGVDGFVRLFDRRSGVLARSISTRTPILSITAPALPGPNYDSGRCFFSDASGCITVSDAAHALTVDTLYGHVGGVPAMHALTEGAAVSGGGGDHTVRLWRPSVRKQILFAETPAASVDAVTMLTPTLVVAGGSGGELYLFHTARRRPVWAVRGGAHGFEDVTVASAFGMERVWVDDEADDDAAASSGAGKGVGDGEENSDSDTDAPVAKGSARGGERSAKNGFRKDAVSAGRRARSRSRPAVRPITRAAQRVHAMLAREAAAAAATVSYDGRDLDTEATARSAENAASPFAVIMGTPAGGAKRRARSVTPPAGGEVEGAGGRGGAKGGRGKGKGTRGGRGGRGNAADATADSDSGSSSAAEGAGGSASGPVKRSRRNAAAASSRSAEGTTVGTTAATKPSRALPSSLAGHAAHGILFGKPEFPSSSAVARGTVAAAAAAGVHGHFEDIPEPSNPPRHPRWVTALGSIMATNSFFSGSNDGRVRLWAPPIPFLTPSPIASDASHIVGSFAAHGTVNSLCVSDGVGVTSDAGVVVACMSKEPRLGRWWRDRGAQDGVLIVPFRAETAYPDTAEGN